MQPNTRTPNSILRTKRVSKENDESKAAKRNKLATRRVSFAPDDELETRHLYSPKDRAAAALAAARDLADANGAIGPAGQLQTATASPRQDLFAFKPPFGAGAGAGGGPPPASPGDMLMLMSPLSMDLTNNTFQQHMGGLTNQLQGYGAGTGAGPAYDGGLGPTGGADYTRNITLNVPNLATLVEEDEELAYDTSHDALQQQRPAQALPYGAPMDDGSPPPGVGPGAGGRLAAMSPVSPFVLQEMQRKPDDDEDDGNDQLRDRWGFAPGADDTLDVSYGHAVMGDATYNHVYGASATGDITNAMKAGGPAGPSLPGVTTRRMSSVATAAKVTLPQPQHSAAAGPSAAQQQQEQQRDQPNQQQQEPSTGPSAAPMLPPVRAPRVQPTTTPHHGAVENTIKLLEDDHTDAWRLGYHPPHAGGGGGNTTARASVASNKVGGGGYRRLGETTGLLGGTTHLLNTGNMTAQLLADTTSNHRAAMERFLSAMPRQPSDTLREGMIGLPGDATATSISGADMMRAAVAAPLPPHEQQRQQQQRQQQHPVLVQDGTAEFPLDLGSSLSGSDLLGDTGLSLDAFARPPEPTMDLSQQVAVAQAQQAALGAGLAGRGAGGGGAGGQPDGRLLAVAQQQRAVVAPTMTCQDFLGLIDISFNDKVCRTSYLPQSDPPPRSLLEVYEAALVTAPRVAVYQQMMLDLSSRLSNAQAHVGQLEAQLGGSNPGLFGAAQLARPAELESIKDQMVNLKRLCRIRTVKAIKQAHLQILDELLGRLDGSKAALQQELAAMRVSVEQLDRCVQDRGALEAAIAKECEQDEARLQAAVAKRRAMEAQLQRLEDLKAQNAQRVRGLASMRADRQLAAASRPSVEDMQQQRASLEAQAEALRSSATVGLTPGREGQLQLQVARKRDEVAAILGLHGQQLDLSAFLADGSFKMTLRGHFEVACRTGPDGSCRLSARALGGGPPCSSPSLAAAVGATVDALCCIVRASDLPAALECVMGQLHSLSRLVEQLEGSWLRHGVMLKPQVVAESQEQGQEAPAPGVQQQQQQQLLLQFLNAGSVTRLSVSMPWEAALRAHAAAPPMHISMQGLAPRQDEVDALRNGLLSQLGPRRDYLQALCTVLSAIMQDQEQAPVGGGAGSGAPDAGDGSSQRPQLLLEGVARGSQPQQQQPGATVVAAAEPASTPSRGRGTATPGGLTAVVARTPARVFNNPLFTAA